VAETPTPETDELNALGARIESMRTTHSTEAPPPSGGLSALYLFFSLGTSIAGCLVAGFFAGHWLDQRYGTTYWVVVGLLAGLVCGIMGAHRLLKPYLKA
jgi:uncharacterized protein YneF (UPF0154 family)